jgi:hypothetical protein
MQLVDHLRLMAETGALTQRREVLGRDTAIAAAAAYATMFGDAGGDEGGVPATFQVRACGWLWRGYWAMGIGYWLLGRAVGSSMVRQ